MKVFIVDIDGTIADNSHRDHWLHEHAPGGKIDWDGYFEACDKDKPIEHMRWLLTFLPRGMIVYVTGRPERVRNKTINWLISHGFPKGHAMFMREDGDHRPDHVIKLGLLTGLKKVGLEPLMAFDDRQQVVDMWRENGVPCAQVAPSFD